MAVIVGELRREPPTPAVAQDAEILAAQIRACRDALAQFLVVRKWQKALLIVGPTEDDQAYAAALREAKSAGVEVLAYGVYLDAEQVCIDRALPVLLTP